jgi:RNA polymerase sigma-70 factor (ECF subfamily)
VFGKSEAKRTKREFETSCLEHLDALYSNAVKLTRDKSEAEELVQDTYLKALKSAHKFEWGTNLKAWLFRIQINSFINNYRRKGHEHRYQERAATEPIYEQILDSEARNYAADPEAHAFSKFFKQDLDKAMECLPDDYRTVITLADMEDFTYSEIAKMVGCPIGTVMSRLYRARRLLQRELIDYAVEAGIVTPQKTENQPIDMSAFRRLKQESS